MASFFFAILYEREKDHTIALCMYAKTKIQCHSSIVALFREVESMYSKRFSFDNMWFKSHHHNSDIS